MWCCKTGSNDAPLSFSHHRRVSDYTSGWGAQQEQENRKTAVEKPGESLVERV